jgi:hypothetical protein
VQDVQEAKHGDLVDASTRKAIRRRDLDGKLGDYVVGLRKKKFPVEVYLKVYNFVVIELTRQEADMVKELAENAETPGAVTEQRVKELGKLLKP